MLNFEVCLNSESKREIVFGQKFSVDGVVKTTDAKGCLSWEEKLEFNPIIQPRLLHISRKITGEGLIKGYRTVDFIVNPWTKNGAGEATYISKEDLDDERMATAVAKDDVGSYLSGSSYLQSLQIDQRPMIWIQNLSSVQVNNLGPHPKGGQLVELKGSFRPLVLTKGFTY